MGGHVDTIRRGCKSTRFRKPTKVTDYERKRGSNPASLIAELISTRRTRSREFFIIEGTKHDFSRDPAHRGAFLG